MTKSEVEKLIIDDMERAFNIAKRVLRDYPSSSKQFVREHTMVADIMDNIMTAAIFQELRAMRFGQHRHEREDE